MKKLEIINLAVGLLVIVLLGVAGAYLQRLLSEDAADVTTIQTNIDCDLNKQPCKTAIGNQTIEIEFSRPVNYLEKFNIKAHLTGFEHVETVVVDFNMRDMQMGINRFELNKGSIADSWQGMAILPVCVSGRKDWLVKVLLKTKKNSYAIMCALVID